MFDYSNRNFLSQSYQTNLNALELKNVRGSVRLILGKIITPNEVENRINNLFKNKLFDA